MIVVTSDEIEGREVVRTLGLVRGNTIRARHIGRDVSAVLKSIVGGEITDYTKMMAESREQAFDRMVEEAEGLGANAVIGIRYDATEIMQGVTEVLCYGTAVVADPAS